jgi:transposase-like protein
MTSTIAENEVLKQDRRGRVRVPRERREALLEEFARSGLSAAAFAQLAGIKYPTFTNWLQRRRESRGRLAGGPPETVVGGSAIRLLEAVVEDHGSRTLGSGAGLLIELPGGSRLTVLSPAHLALAAELLVLVAQRSR